VSSHRDHVTPVGGPLWTPAMKVLAGIFGIAMLLVAYRFIFGIGSVSALNDGYPWGSWKILNVLVLTALGSGGYALAFVVYALNRGKYHPLIRTAILTSVMGYTTGVIALGMDIGRPWNFWWVIMPWKWNIHSPLLEIAVCISAYLIFLWIEMAMPMFERWSQEPDSRLRRFSIRATRTVEKFFPLIMGMAIVLPTMHQSSLGSLFLVSGPRVHALWQTPLLPLFFLFSCFMMGYAAVVIASTLSSVTWKRPLEFSMLRQLSGVMGLVIAIHLVTRFVDVAARGALGSAFAFDGYSLWFLLEVALLAIPAYWMMARKAALTPGLLFKLAAMVALGGTVYRLGPSLIGFMPGSHWSYFPSVAEMTITLGFVALALMGYIVTVKRFPILTAYPAPVRAAPDATGD
jgi:Ni/Fe-hydrogenase subunit HybB-like protein